MGTAATSDLRGSGPCSRKYLRNAPLHTISTASFRLAWWRRRTVLRRSSGRLTAAKARCADTVVLSLVRGASPRLLTLLAGLLLPSTSACNEAMASDAMPPPPCEAI